MAVNKENLKQMMRDKRLVVLNVESEADYSNLHIEGSLSLPWGQDHGAFAQAAEKAYGKNRPFVLYCSDITSAAGSNAANFLKGHNFNADVYPGGMKEWLDAGFPVSGNASIPVPVLG